jgi:hypothetical protein
MSQQGTISEFRAHKILLSRIIFSKVSEIYIICEKENLCRGIQQTVAVLAEMVLTIKLSRDVSRAFVSAFPY